MITIKHILDQVNYAEDESNIVRGLSELADLGLFEENKLPLIKRALSKRNVNEMTEAEKKTLQESLGTVIDNLILEKKEDHLSKLDTKRKASYPSEKDMPVIIVLKRKAIRVFPDNQKVGLYYSQALDKYVSIPFGKKSKNMAVDMNEELETRTPITDISNKKAKKEKNIANITKDRFDGFSTQDKTRAAVQMMPAQRSSIPGATSKAMSAAWRSGHKSVALGVGLGDGMRKVGRGIANLVSPPKQENIPSAVPKKKFLKIRPKINSKPVTSIQGKGPVQQSSSSYGMFGESKSVFKRKIEEKRKQKQLDELAPILAPIAAGAKILAATMGTRLASKAVLPLIRSGKLNSKMADAVKKAKDAKSASKTNVKKPGKKDGILDRAGAKISDKLKGLKDKATTMAAGAVLANAAAGSESNSDDGASFKRPEGDPSHSTIGTHLKGNTFGAPRSPVPGSADVAAIEVQKRRWNQQSGMAVAGGRQNTQAMNEDLNNFNKIRILSERKHEKAKLVFENTDIQINNTIAKKILNLHESLNKRNKKKLEKMINEDSSSIRKVINFAVRQQ